MFLHLNEVRGNIPRGEAGGSDWDFEAEGVRF